MVTDDRLPCQNLARLAARRKTRAKGPRAAATMTAAGRLGRLAALLLLPALARGWDWSTNVDADDGADAADSLDGRDDDIRARRRRGTSPPHPSPAHNSTHYNTRAFVLAASKTLASSLAEQSARGSPRTHASKALDGAATDE